MTWTATNSEGYEAPAALKVDTVVMTVRDARLVVIAAGAPGDRRVLPGGFAGRDEAPQETAARKLAEKAGVRGLWLEQLGAFARPDRDPRGWIPSIAYLALVPPSTEPADGGAAWVDARGDHRWAYDHGAIVRSAIDRIEGQLWWSNVAAGILADPFSLSDARTVYEAIAQVRYDPATFARDLKATGLIAPTGATRREPRGRPAALYRFASNRFTWGAGRRKRVATS